MRRSRERRLTMEWKKMSGGASSQMLARAVLRHLEVDTQLQGVRREAMTCFRCEGEAWERQGEERVLELLL
jgi:hypothetical protein